MRTERHGHLILYSFYELYIYVLTINKVEVFNSSWDALQITAKEPIIYSLCVLLFPPLSISLSSCLHSFSYLIRSFLILLHVLLSSHSYFYIFFFCISLSSFFNFSFSSDVLFHPFLPPAFSCIYTFSLLFFSCFLVPPFFPPTSDYCCARNCSSKAVRFGAWTHTVPSSRNRSGVKW